MPAPRNWLQSDHASITVRRTEHRLLPDARRVLAKPFLPGEEVLLPGPSRARLLMERILAIPEQQATRWSRRSAEASRRAIETSTISSSVTSSSSRTTSTRACRSLRERRLLIGACFTHEYSVEAAALFNPSIVLAPDQTGVARRRAALRDEPARGRRRPPVLDRVPLGGHRRARRADVRSAGLAARGRPPYAARSLRQATVQRQARRARRGQ